MAFIVFDVIPELNGGATALSAMPAEIMDIDGEKAAGTSLFLGAIRIREQAASFDGCLGTDPEPEPPEPVVIPHRHFY